MSQGSQEKIFLKIPEITQTAITLKGINKKGVVWPYLSTIFWSDLICTTDIKLV